MTMTWMELLILLAIAGACGFVAQLITGFTRGGCLVSVALGFIGALVGLWIAAFLGLPAIFAVQVGEQSFPVLWAFVGALVLVLLLGVLTEKRH